LASIFVLSDAVQSQFVGKGQATISIGAAFCFPLKRGIKRDVFRQIVFILNL
jgi:hypothetical protein